MRHKTPKKPDITSAPMAVLVEHFNSRLDAYNAATTAFCQARKIDPTPRLMAPVDESISRELLVKMSRRLHVRLGDTIRDRAIQLLLEKKLDENGHALFKDGQTVGHSYDEILEIINHEHPYGSTSAACLRWYIVQVQEDCDDDGELLYEFPEWRARSAPKRRDDLPTIESEAA